MNNDKGFTLIELLVVIAIIAFLSSVIFVTLTTTRKKARDNQRIQNARQIAIALEQYEHSNNTYKIIGAGLNSNNGSGYVVKGSGDSGYSNSILSVLKSAGYLTSTNLIDPIYGKDNYYLGVCTSTNAYNVFVKLEQSQYKQATSSILNSCSGAEAAAEGFSFITNISGGSSGGGGDNTGYSGYAEGGGMASPCPINISGPDGLTYNSILAEDGRCWLDRNMGATRIATAYNDYQSYGSKFQWGRGTDGHQLITYSGASAGSSVNGSTTVLSASSSPGDNLFIKSANDWLSATNNTLWQGSNSINNPCPIGFHVPTTNEWQTWENLTGVTYASCGAVSSCLSAVYNTKLKIPTTGGRGRADGIPFWVGSYGYYWTSTVVSGTSNVFLFYPTAASANNAYTRAYGFSVRCIKD